ncbi:MAG TPA: hypothetical protein VKP30_12490, partial [Polyangiaceae bacterium]|nr:hypothetical protein [Polyangiaceae bacterium]
MIPQENEEGRGGGATPRSGANSPAGLLASGTRTLCVSHARLVSLPPKNWAAFCGAEELLVGMTYVGSLRQPIELTRSRWRGPVDDR